MKTLILPTAVKNEVRRRMWEFDKETFTSFDESTWRSILIVYDNKLSLSHIQRDIQSCKKMLNEIQHRIHTGTCRKGDNNRTLKLYRRTMHCLQPILAYYSLPKSEREYAEDGK